MRICIEFLCMNCQWIKRAELAEQLFLQEATQLREG